MPIWAVAWLKIFIRLLLLLKRQSRI